MTKLEHLEVLLNEYAVAGNSCIIQDQRTCRLYGDYWCNLWGQLNTDFKTIAASFETGPHIRVLLGVWAPTKLKLIEDTYYIGEIDNGIMHWFKL